MKTLSARIQHILKMKGWSSADLARAGGVSRAAVSDWLAGNVASMSPHPATRIADAAGVDPMWLATGRGRIDSQSSASASEHWPFTVPRSDFERLSDADKRDLDTTVSRFIAGCLAQRESAQMTVKKRVN